MHTARTRKIWARLTAASQLCGFTLPSRHFLSSASQRAQSRHSIASLFLVISALAALAAATAQAPKVTLTYFQEHFIVRDGAFNESAPLRLTPTTPKLSTVFRKNNTYAVWDERGLTVRVGDSVRSSKLPSIVLSPKGFTRDEILFTNREIKAGRRSVDVAALSGAVRVANKVYFL